MKKFKAFTGKYKTYFALSLCLLFAVIAGFFAMTNEIEKENRQLEETKETRAFIARGNEESSDKVYKKETITVMPDERVSKDAEAIPEAFPDSAYEKEPIVTKDSLEKSAVPAVSSTPFSPVMPVSGEKLIPYTVSPIYSATMGDWRSHEAIDISSDVGEPVVASERGTVKFVGKDSLLGFCIRISHEGGFESLYANLHGETTVIEGQFVEKGHPIGYVGESSLIESEEVPHLHFELLKNGKRVNPEEYIR